jgi:uncharacterized protein YndB with AHSA1/START domain
VADFQEMPQFRQQALINAPVQVVWDLVADPNCHPEWWPTVVEADCEDPAEGCQYRGVVKNPFGAAVEHEFTLERLEGCREVLIRCHGTGVWNRWLFTEAQGGTFVDAEFGAEPKGVGMRVFGVVAGKRYLRRWLQQSLDALEAACRDRVRSTGRS